MRAATKWLCRSVDIRVAECRMLKIILQYFCSHCSVSVTPPLHLLQLIMCPQQSNITCNLPAHSVEPHNDHSSPSRVWIHQNIWTKIKLSGVRCSGWPEAAVTSEPDMQVMFANGVHLHTLRIYEETIMNRCKTSWALEFEHTSLPLTVTLLWIRVPISCGDRWRSNTHLFIIVQYVKVSTFFRNCTKLSNNRCMSGLNFVLSAPLSMAAGYLPSYPCHVYSPLHSAKQITGITEKIWDDRLWIMNWHQRHQH